MLCACYFIVVNVVWSRDCYWTSRKQVKAEIKRKLAVLFAIVQRIFDSWREICLHECANHLYKVGRKHSALPGPDKPREARDRNKCRNPAHLTYSVKWLWLDDEKKMRSILGRWKEFSVILTQLFTIVLKPSAHLHLAQDPSDFLKTTVCPTKYCLLSQLVSHEVAQHSYQFAQTF